MADRELTPVQQRTVFAVVVAGLAAAGIAWSLGGGGEEEGGRAEPTPSPSSPAREAAPGAEEVADWFPWTPEEFAAAGGAAEEFAASLATVEAGEGFEAYADRVGEATAHGYTGVLETEDGDTGPWRALAGEEGVTWTGRAAVQEIVYYDSQSITFTVSAEARPDDAGADPKELGDYSVTLESEKNGWTVVQADYLG